MEFNLNRSAEDISAWRMQLLSIFANYSKVKYIPATLSMAAKETWKHEEITQVNILMRG